MNSIDLLRKKILYRSEYRGIKEMELLLNSFVQKHISDFSIVELKILAVRKAAKKPTKYKNKSAAALYPKNGPKREVSGTNAAIKRT